ncbi:hypothetical protein KR018_010891, partial [Drosophila ironensis]
KIILQLINLHSVYSMAFILCFIYTIGVLAIANFLYDNLKSVFSIIVAVLQPYLQAKVSKTLVERYGEWAVVTGSTDGIGKEYAKELARQGLNIVLISRTKEKLISVASDIENQYKVKTKWIAVDFAKGREIYDEIEKGLKGIDVGILGNLKQKVKANNYKSSLSVNNVGMMYEHPENLHLISEELLWDLMTVNMGSVTMMTRKILPQMIGRRKGAIVNIGSASELQPLPTMTVYTASKKFVTFFSKALEQEVKEHNIDVQLVMPGIVITKMNAYSDRVMSRGGLPMLPFASTYSKFAVFTLGKTSETNGYWAHGIQYFLMKLAPMPIRTLLGHRMFNRFRNEALEKKQK